VPTGPGEARRIRVPGLIQIDNAAVFADGRRLALVGRPDPVSPNRLYVFDTEHGEATLAGSVRDATTVIIPEASHHMIRQDPVRTSAAVLDFLAS